MSYRYGRLFRRSSQLFFITSPQQTVKSVIPQEVSSLVAGPNSGTPMIHSSATLCCMLENLSTKKESLRCKYQAWLIFEL